MNTNFLIAICTLGKNKNLQNCLNTLVEIKNKSKYNIEILVVINGTMLDFELPSNIKIVYEPLLGFSNSRNAAIKARPADFNLIFIDDDEIPTESWLNELLTIHNRFPLDIIAGPVLPLNDYKNASYRDKFESRYNRLKDEEVIKHSGAGNMLFPSELLDRDIVYFDPFFNFLGSEDTDLCFRIYNLKIKIRYAKKALIYEIPGVNKFSQDYIDQRFIREVANYSLIIRRNSTKSLIVWRFLTSLTRYLYFSIATSYSKKHKIKRDAYQKSLICLLSGKSVN